MVPGHVVEAQYQARCDAIVAGRTASFSQAFQDWWLYHSTSATASENII